MRLFVQPRKGVFTLQLYTIRELYTRNSINRDQNINILVLNKQLECLIGERCQGAILTAAARQ